MVRLNGPTTHVQWRRRDLFDAHRFQAVHRANDIDDRIELADLVKMDVVDCHAVNGCLCFGESPV